MRKYSFVLVVIAILALASFAAFAGAGDTPAKPGCQKAAGAKACAHGSEAKACCAHQKDMMAAYDALQKDLAMMEKGIPAADQATFMKSHEANLKKFVDAHAACQKECQMKKDAPKAAEPDEKK